MSYLFDEHDVDSIQWIFPPLTKIDWRNLKKGLIILKGFLVKAN